jgi:hypothetical protein
MSRVWICHVTHMNESCHMNRLYLDPHVGKTKDILVRGRDDRVWAGAPVVVALQHRHRAGSLPANSTKTWLVHVCFIHTSRIHRVLSHIRVRFVPHIWTRHVAYGKLYRTMTRSCVFYPYIENIWSLVTHSSEIHATYMDASCRVW